MAEMGEKPADTARLGELRLERLDREELERFGKILDQRPATLRGRTVGMALGEQLLVVRTRDGRPAPLKANATQRAFERRRGQRNIVLKARQMGLTTWAAARFFLKTITNPGTLTLEVAHTQEAAEEIFRIVHRFVDFLPEQLREGPLRTSQANVRQIVFPELDAQYRVVSAGDRNAGRGLTVQNLHCSELARWPGDPAETLAGLRAALSPGAELILESTPDGVGGCFYEEWRKAGETEMVRHFFPWWLERRYRADAVDRATLTRGRARVDGAAPGSAADWIPAEDPGGLSRAGAAGVRRGRRELLYGQRGFGLRAGGDRGSGWRTMPSRLSGGAMGRWKSGCLH